MIHRPELPKVYEPYVNWATKVMLGAKLKDFQFKPRLDGYRACAKPLRRRQGAIKVPVFSFDKFPNVTRASGRR